MSKFGFLPSALLLLLAFFLTVVAGDGDQIVIPVEFTVKLRNGVSGTFVMEVHPDWAPLGAERFLELVDNHPTFWNGIRFFRVIEGFMAQFGIAAKPDVAAIWKDKTIVDDPVIESNLRGYVSFATSGKDSRTTQMFINLVDNTNLDGMDFAPFARVTTGMEDVVDQLYSGYGEGAPSGKGPDQGRIQSEGNKYLKRQFPKMTFIESVRRLDVEDKEF